MLTSAMRMAILQFTTLQRSTSTVPNFRRCCSKLVVTRILRTGGARILWVICSCIGRFTAVRTDLWLCRAWDWPHNTVTGTAPLILLQRFPLICNHLGASLSLLPLNFSSQHKILCSQHKRLCSQHKILCTQHKRLCVPGLPSSEQKMRANSTKRFAQFDE